MDKVQESVDALCLEVRQVAGELPDLGKMKLTAVPLVDSFALSDHIINSPLGKWDGSVYESYFAQVQASNPTPKVHPYFDRLIKPLLERRNDEMEDLDTAIGLDDELKEMAEEREAAAKEEKEKKARGKGKGKGEVEEVRREDSWHDSRGE